MTDLPKEFRFYSRQCQHLRRILKETCCALDDFNKTIYLEKDFTEDLYSQDVFDKLQRKLESTPTLIILGQSCHAKALFLNTFLGQLILPLFGSKWRHITFVYGVSKNIRLIYGDDYELVDNLQAHDKPWITIPEADLLRNDQEHPIEHCPSLEIGLSNQLLKENVKIMVPPDCEPALLLKVLNKRTEGSLPLFIYAVYSEELSEADILEIQKVREVYQCPILFVAVSNEEVLKNRSMDSLTESEQHLREQNNAQKSFKHLQNLHDQLKSLGYINGENNPKTDEIIKRRSFCSECSLNNTQVIKDSNSVGFSNFVSDYFKSTVWKMAATLSDIHNRCLRSFILSAFDMAREIQITSKRILYAQKVEMRLSKTLIKIANDQQEEITRIIERTLRDMRSNVSDVLKEYENDESNSLNGKMGTLRIQDLILNRLRNLVADQIIQSISCLQESFTGTLQRCLESLEKNCHDLDVNLSASNAVKQILTAAYNIDLKTSTSFSAAHLFMDRLRKLLSNLVMPWSSSCHIQGDFQWKIQVVTNMLDSLSAPRLAKTICSQFQEHIKLSHEAFQSAIRSIETQLSGQMEHTEEQRVKIRKRHAPRFAKLALKSTSLCDVVQWGMPQQIREIGRGQYGVVSSCEPWGGINPCAFKSVVPPDDRNWKDLAMEFYYTRTIPEHPRIVKLRGSVIDYTYGGGNSSAVLLIMERMTRDLYCGLKGELLPWLARLQISIDVIEGIRYLHSQGLIHRDIKLKNVLLDNNDRAKLTDFGFCIPEALMSGSIVGTPIHMAPELLSGRYDSSVDVYAFGILFWYICANRTRLPCNFEDFTDKDQLWKGVIKGRRPECLPEFDQACWNLMEQCWAAEPSKRPLLGDVQPQLEVIFDSEKLNSLDT